MNQVLKFSELLIAKLCHDLSGPIGALCNAVEFLELDGMGDGAGKTNEIITSNINILANQLKFFRYVYASSSENYHEVDILGIEEVTRSFFAHSKITVSFDNEKTGKDYVQLSSRGSKLVMLLVYLASKSLLYGGQINVKLSKGIDGSKSVTIQAKSSKKIRQFEAYQTIFGASGGDKIEPKLDDIVAYKAALLMDEMKTLIAVEQLEKLIRFNFKI